MMLYSERDNCLFGIKMLNTRAENETDSDIYAFYTKIAGKPLLWSCLQLRAYNYRIVSRDKITILE